MQVNQKETAGADRPKNPEQQAVPTESCFRVNEPFRGKAFVANKQLSPEVWAKLEAAIPQEETLKFVVMGDLSIKSKYAETFLAVTDKLIYGFDETMEGGLRTHTFDKVKRAYVKRYYGNAMLVFSMDESGKEFVDLSCEYVNFIRFSYKVASVYDAAAIYIQNIAGG